MDTGQGTKLVDRLEGIKEENLFHLTKSLEIPPSTLEYSLHETDEYR